MGQGFAVLKIYNSRKVISKPKSWVQLIGMSVIIKGLLDLRQLGARFVFS